MVGVLRIILIQDNVMLYDFSKNEVMNWKMTVK